MISAKDHNRNFKQSFKLISEKSLQNPSNWVLSGSASPVPISTCKSELWASHFHCQIVFHFLEEQTTALLSRHRGIASLAGRRSQQLHCCPYSAPRGTTHEARYSVDGQTTYQWTLRLESWAIKNQPYPYQKHSPKKVAKDIFGPKNLFKLLEDT